MKARLRKLVFESRIGDLLLYWLERWAGLAVVEVEDLDGKGS